MLHLPFLLYIIRKYKAKINLIHYIVITNILLMMKEEIIKKHSGLRPVGQENRCEFALFEVELP